MFRQRTGSVVCASCGSLVGVNDDKCYTCGRRNPGLWGFGPVLRRFGNDLGFVSLVVYGCAASYAATLLVTVPRGKACSQDLFLDPRTEQRSAPDVRRQRRLSGVRLRPLVDHPECRLAARRRPPHPVQHDVGPADRSGRCRHLRRRADGDHLHRVVRDRISAQLLHGRVLADSLHRRGRPRRSARPRPSSGCSARWSTTEDAAAAAW